MTTGIYGAVDIFVPHFSLAADLVGGTNFLFHSARLRKKMFLKQEPKALGQKAPGGRT